MLRKLMVLAALVALPVVGVADDAKMTWDYEGYQGLIPASAKAKAEGKLILLGLSGGAT